MRKIIYYIAISADGYIARKDGSISGFLMEGEHADEFMASMQSFDYAIMGTKTYEFGFQYGLKPGEPAYQGLKHLVVSRSLTFESNDQVKLLDTDAESYIRELKTKPGKNIWLCGGGKLASTMLNNRLIDEIYLKVNPFIIGDGIRLFDYSSKPVHAQLLGTKSYSNGVILQKYKLEYSNAGNRL